MKKCISLFMTLIVVFLFSACANQDDYSDETKKITMDVYNCLLEGDSEKLRSLFCENTRNSPGFDQKVQDFMEGIGGCIVSGDTENYHYDVGARTRNKGTAFGDYDVLNALGYIDNIEDNNGIIYKNLLISYVYRYTEDTTHEGLRSIILSDNDRRAAFSILPDE